MNGLFLNCSNLISLPDISLWNTKNVINMAFMFGKLQNLLLLASFFCKLNVKNYPWLSSFPFFSKSNYLYVQKIKEKLVNCINLKSLHDISLSSLPDLSNWNLKNVNSIKGMFNNCSNLFKIPDISKWNDKNIQEINNLSIHFKKLFHFYIKQFKNNNNK